MTCIMTCIITCMMTYIRTYIMTCIMTCTMVIRSYFIRSTTGKKWLNLKNEFDLDPWVTPSSVFKTRYMYYDVPDADKWRLPLLQSLMKERYEMSVSGDETEDITGLIESSAHLEWSFLFFLCELGTHTIPTDPYLRKIFSITLRELQYYMYVPTEINNNNNWSWIFI